MALDLAGIYRDLHARPELAFQETRTAGLVAGHLTNLGYEVSTGIGVTGVVGVLRSGDGPTALLRADMDGLPVREQTGLDYASSSTATDADGGEQHVMHACGHDMHVTCLLGAAERLATERETWRGTLVVLFQPAEEAGAGAQAMVDDGLFDRVPRPHIVLGQHVAPIPVGVIGLRPGSAFAAADSMRITLHGRGAHGSRPEASVDPIVMAAAVVLRLQTIVAREVAAADSIVVTVGAIHAGAAVNVIPDRAELLVNVRSHSPHARARVLKAIERMVTAEAVASGATTMPDIESIGSFPAVVNDPDAVARTRPVLEELPSFVVDPGPVTGSEDVGMLATAAGAPCVFWLLGGADPAAFDGAVTIEEIAARVDALPSNHSPFYAPVIEPTLTNGVNALVAAARVWLPV